MSASGFTDALDSAWVGGDTCQKGQGAQNRSWQRKKVSIVRPAFADMREELLR